MFSNSMGRLAPAGRSRVIIALALALIGALAFTAMAAHPAEAGKKKKKPNTVKVMTRNLYLGADLGPAINSSGAADFISKNGQILRDVDTNNFKVRAKSLANEIKSVSPDLVGLQEVALWRTGEPSLTPSISGNYVASTVHVDYLKELMAQLNKGKKRYRVVRVQNEFDFEAPADYDNNPATGALTLGGEINGRLTMRDAIIAKVGAGVQTKNAKSGNFETIYQPVISGITIDVDRGWLSTDVKVRNGKWFRFVNTHLEAFGDTAIREAQAKELIAPGGPLRSGKLPAILVGDLNSDDDTVTGGDRGVGGGAVHLPGPAGGEDDARRAEYPPLAFSPHEHLDAGDPPALREDLRRERVLEDGDLALGERGERQLDLEAGGVAARVQDARTRVRRLAAEGDLAVGGVEAHPVADEVRDARRGLVAEDARGLFVDEPGAGLDGVLQVVAGVVVRADGGGDAALRVAGAGLADAALGDDEDACAGLVRLERRVQPGDPGADDDEVVLGVSWRRHRGCVIGCALHRGRPRRRRTTGSRGRWRPSPRGPRGGPSAR